jgi:hypothetical protein
MPQVTPSTLIALGEISHAAAFENLQIGIRKVLEAAVVEEGLSYRATKGLLPVVNRAIKKATTEQDRIRLTEVLTLVKTKCEPAKILEAFKMAGAQIQTIKTIAETISEQGRTEVEHGFEITAQDTGLRAEAEALSVARKSEHGLGVEDVLHALDARMPYAKKPSQFRPMAELRQELAWFMEADAIIAATDSTNPYGVAARKRIEIMKQMPRNSVEPVWFSQLKWACLCDLMFLGRVAGKNFTHWTHRRMTDHLVTKNPLKAIEEQDEIKNRLTLAGRGSFKSTISVLDVLQWTLAFPDEIKVMVCTSVAKLAKRFIGELKQYLIRPKGAEQTNLQKLFSEYVFAPEEDGKANEYTVKGRKSASKDPSVWAASVSSDEVGSHVSLLVFDDAQSVENSSTPETLETLVYKCALLKALVDPGGYRQYLGTPLLPGDMYAQLQDSIPDLKVLYQPALTRKPSSLHKEEIDCGESDFDLHFPERLTWMFLEATKREQPAVYKSQYLLDPRGEGTVTFDIDLLMNRTIKPDNFPQQLSYVISVDLAYSTGSKSDSSTIVVAGIDLQGRCFIADIRHGRFTPEEIAQEIVSVYMTYHPNQVVIENSNGASILEVVIRSTAREKGIDNIVLNFLKVDTRRNAKANRIGVLHPLLVRSQLFFSSSLDCLQDLYEQFSKFGFSRFDDIPDCVSLLFASGAAPMRPERPDPAIQRKIEEERNYGRFYDMLFPEQPIKEEPIIPEEGTGTDLEDIWNPYASTGFGGRR